MHLYLRKKNHTYDRKTWITVYAIVHFTQSVNAVYPIPHLQTNNSNDSTSYKFFYDLQNQHQEIESLQNTYLWKQLHNKTKIFVH